MVAADDSKLDVNAVEPDTLGGGHRSHEFEFLNPVDQRHCIRGVVVPRDRPKSTGEFDGRAVVRLVVPSRCPEAGRVVTRVAKGRARSREENRASDRRPEGENRQCEDRGAAATHPRIKALMGPQPSGANDT